MRRYGASTYALLAVLPVLFALGCGGNGPSSPPISVTVAPASPPPIEQGQAVNVAAFVSNDSSAKGVTWSLAGQGSLTNQTSSSVTYTAPASVPSNFTATVTATSAANSSKSAFTSISVMAIGVTITKTVSKLAVGTAVSPGQPIFFEFDAAVQNDPTDSSVTWTLTAAGTACSPTCGSLSNVAPGSVFYTPPSNVPATPNNMPTITATSITDPSKSASDAFTLFDGATACGTGGNESALKGEYAILLQGWAGSGTGTPIILAASFAADGTGKVTFGQDQINHFTSSIGSGLVPSASSYSVGSDGRGCLTLTSNVYDTTVTFQFALGSITGGVASKGDIIELTDTADTAERASGILRLQDPSSFSLSALAPNYAFGVDGWDNTGGSLKHFALVGSFAQSGGNIPGFSFDANDGGSLLNTGGILEIGNGSFGTIQPIATGTGGTSAVIDLPDGSSNQVTVDIYVINSSELFFISNQISPEGAVFSGRAISQPSSFTSASVLPSYIFRSTGGSSGSPSASIGLASFSGGISGTVSGTMLQDAGGTATSQSLTGSYAFNANSGRLEIAGTSSATSPTLYLTTPFDGVSAFSISTDASASLGIFDTQPAATYSNTSLSGNFFFGSNEPAGNTVFDISGIASISAGNLQGTNDQSGPTGFSLGSPVSAALSISANGSGSLGANTVAVTNGTVLFFIDETSTLPPVVQVFEP
ncbi:MAG: hypothetical protein ACYDCD_11275 [Candidatus Acidiferrales bacterium]